MFSTELSEEVLIVWEVKASLLSNGYDIDEMAPRSLFFMGSGILVELDEAHAQRVYGALTERSIRRAEKQFTAKLNAEIGIRENNHG